LKLASSTWDDAEKAAILQVVESGQYTMGEKVSDFERAYAEFCGSKYCVMVNSGSSANLLMVAAYTLRYGADTVIVPALGWSTSYSPFQQYGWKLHFVDIDRETLNYDLSGLWRAAMHYHDPLILAVNVLGNPNHFHAFPRKCHIIEDNCESMGAVYGGKVAGSIGVMGSHSCFFAHHICTMEGGMVTTDDEYFYHMLLSLRSHGWTRHLPKNNVLRAKVEQWNFILPGYNVRPVEMAGAIGLEQVKKLPKIIRQRRENAAKFPLQKQKEIGESSWYGFALLSDEPDELKAMLDRKGIEHRPVISGNFLRHPTMKHYNYIADPLPNADYVHDHGVMIGNHAQEIDWSILA
jgi:CDP-6-deoxy-D-xylo-4-hexulose-3-dehydrase